MAMERAEQGLKENRRAPAAAEEDQEPLELRTVPISFWRLSRSRRRRNRNKLVKLEGQDRFGWHLRV